MKVKVRSHGVGLVVDRKGIDSISKACADVTLWEHLATDRFEPGQLILLENLWTKLGTSGRPVLSASPKHGAKLTNRVLITYLPLDCIADLIMTSCLPTDSFNFQACALFSEPAHHTSTFGCNRPGPVEFSLPGDNCRVVAT